MLEFIGDMLEFIGDMLEFIGDMLEFIWENIPNFEFGQLSSTAPTPRLIEL